MWNPLKIRSVEARRLEIRIVELEDDVGKLVRLIERIDARQRGRNSRSAEPAPDSARSGGDGAGTDRQLPDARPALVGGEQSPVYSKEQLRQFARSRGLSA